MGHRVFRAIVPFADANAGQVHEEPDGENKCGAPLIVARLSEPQIHDAAHRATIGFALAVWPAAAGVSSAAIGKGGGFTPDKAPEYRDIQFAPTGEQIEVADVQIRGNRVTPRSQIEGLLRTRRGRIFDPEVLQADVHSLLDRGRFSDVKTYTQRTPAGMVVIFEVLEPPKIEYVRYVGNKGSRWNIFAKGISDYTLDKEVGLKKGESLNVYAVEEARRRLENVYREKGYAKAEVEVIEGDKPHDRGVVFLISEGSVERIYATRSSRGTRSPPTPA
jgi:outer membrane protein assembly factor BamA